MDDVVRMEHVLTAELADRFAGIALGHVTREYPNKLDHVLNGPADARGPRDLHPVFYGSFDWHSCVHGYWMLAHLYRRFPAILNGPAIRALFDVSFTPERIAGECAYLAAGSTSGFERPYGWAWLLKLAAELALFDSEVWASRWRAFFPTGSCDICRWPPIPCVRACTPTPPSRFGLRWIIPMPRCVRWLLTPLAAGIWRIGIARLGSRAVTSFSRLP